MYNINSIKFSDQSISLLSSESLFLWKFYLKCMRHDLSRNVSHLWLFLNIWKPGLFLSHYLQYRIQYLYLLYFFLVNIINCVLPLSMDNLFTLSQIEIFSSSLFNLLWMEFKLFLSKNRFESTAKYIGIVCWQINARTLMIYHYHMLQIAFY